MKKKFILILLSITYMICNGQLLVDNFEIWGYKGTKQEFIDKYNKKTGVDLNNGSYACSGTLLQMGFAYSFSITFRSPLDQITGQTNYQLGERLVIVRQIPKNKYTNKALSKEWQTSIRKLVHSINKMDINQRNKYIKDHIEVLNEILIGTLSPYQLTDIRTECNNFILRDIDLLTNNLTLMQLEILSAMLSFPDPYTCYSAIKILSKKITKSKEVVLSENAETLKEFLNSNLQTFRIDAMKFLIGLEPKGKNWTQNDWIKWLGASTISFHK